MVGSPLFTYKVILCTLIFTELSAEEMAAFRRIIVEDLRTIHFPTEKHVAKRVAFESAIRRPYFHAKPLGEGDHQCVSAHSHIVGARSGDYMFSVFLFGMNFARGQYLGGHKYSTENMKRAKQ